MTTVQVRIDEKTKREAKRVLDGLGIDMSGAIKLYLRQISLHRGIPLPLRTKNGLTPQQEVEILTASSEAKEGKNVSKKMSPRQALDYLNSLS